MSTSTFTIQTPDLYEYVHDELEISVLGGIRMDKLDSLRVTLKMQFGHLAIRHNLDLYNDTQVYRLVRRTAGKLEIGSILVQEALECLTEKLESYRIEERKTLGEETIETVELSKKEIKAAETYLSTPHLIERTGEDIGKAGVIGEETNRLLMYIIFTSRKLRAPLNVISMGSSGVGKSHLQEQVAALIPDEELIEMTDLSENAFYYFGQNELSHKLLLIEDMDGAEDALYPLRELQSKRRISKTLVKKTNRGTRTVSLRVEGPVCTAGCTTQEQIYEDNANRSFLLQIDESAEQDERVMQYQREKSAGKINVEIQHEIKQRFQNMQRILKTVTIINPYAKYLKLPPSVFKPRRTNAHYLAFIEAVTFYHQYQRAQEIDEETGEIFIEVTPEDIRTANSLLGDVLLRKSDTLSGACRRFFEWLKAHLKLEQKTRYKTRDIRKAIRISSSTLSRYQNALLEEQMIRIVGGSKAKGYKYEVCTMTDYEKLEKEIEMTLSRAIVQIQQVA